MNNNFYTSNCISFYEGGELFKSVEAIPIKMKRFEQFKFFLHGERYDWRISELNTGQLISHRYDTKEKVTEEALDRLKIYGKARLQQAINKNITERMLCDKRCGRTA